MLLHQDGEGVSIFLQQLMEDVEADEVPSVLAYPVKVNGQVSDLIPI